MPNTLPRHAPPALTLALALVLSVASAAQAGTTLFSQPVAASPVLINTAMLWPDGTATDMKAWDNFHLAVGGTVTGVQWVGTGPDFIDSFGIAFYNDISAIPYNWTLGYTLASVIQPDVGAGPVKSMNIAQNQVTRTADATHPGAWLYSVNLSTSRQIALDANRSYWMLLQAHQTVGNGWSVLSGSGDHKGFIFGGLSGGGGDGSYRFTTTDMAFSLTGNALAAVPEPAPAVAMLAGLCALFGMSRRRSRD